MERTTNFNAGPAALPLEVLQKAQKEFIVSSRRGKPSILNASDELFNT